MKVTTLPQFLGETRDPNGWHFILHQYGCFVSGSKITRRATLSESSETPMCLYALLKSNAKASSSASLSAARIRFICKIKLPRVSGRYVSEHDVVSLTLLAFKSSINRGLLCSITKRGFNTWFEIISLVTGFNSDTFPSSISRKVISQHFRIASDDLLSSDRIIALFRSSTESSTSSRDIFALEVAGGSDPAFGMSPVRGIPFIKSETNALSGESTNEERYSIRAKFRCFAGESSGSVDFNRSLRGSINSEMC